MVFRVLDFTPVTRYRLLVTQPISTKGLFVYFTGLKGLKFLFLSEFLTYLLKLPGSTAKISGKFSRLRC